MSPQPYNCHDCCACAKCFDDLRQITLKFERDLASRTAELASAKEELKESQTLHQSWRSQCLNTIEELKKLRTDYIELTKENAELREAFNTWSEHQPGCPTGWGKQCDCGLAEVRAQLEGK